MNYFLIQLIDDEIVSSFDLRNELLLASPRVTDRVLIATIERDPAMYPCYVAQVLLPLARFRKMHSPRSVDQISTTTAKNW